MAVKSENGIGSPADKAAPKNGSLGGLPMIGAAGLPNLTGGGSSAASANYGQTRYGNVTVTGGSGAWFWIFMLGTVGAIVWYKVKKK